MKIVKYIPALSVAATLFVLAGCYPQGPEYASDYDVVATDYDETYWSQNSPQTYYMPDTLGWILDRDDVENIVDDLDRDYDDFILGVVEDNLDDLGYERLDTLNGDNWPDVFVFTQAIAVKNTGTTWYPWYPWYGGGWYPWWGWGGYYPGYYPVSYSFNTGTILIEMGDAKDLDDERQQIKMVWTAGIDGLLRSSKSSNQDYVRKNIRQAFEQSPYLNSN